MRYLIGNPICSWTLLILTWAQSTDLTQGYRKVEDAFKQGRNKRWSFDEQKDSFLGKLPFGLGDNEEPESKSDVETWTVIRAKSKRAFESYKYPVNVYYKSHKLQVIGQFLVTHKYFEVDWRFEGRQDKMGKEMHFAPMYMRHFPIPRLKTLHPDVASACKQGVNECIDEIFSIAILTWSAQDRHLRQDLILPVREEAIIYPFSSRVKLFNYRVTASYYMCWYTMREEKLLAHFKHNCLDFSYDYQAVDKKWPKDYRADDMLPYGCAMLAFCPDICCGRPPKEGAVNLPSDCWSSARNPCRDVANGVCEIPRLENVNFDDLIRNRINYTCECDKVNKGFEWIAQFELCVDKDECYDNTYQCFDHEVCQNTVGGYKCVCQYGYTWDEGNYICARHHAVVDMVKSIVTSAPSDPPIEKTGYTLIDDIKLLYSLFALAPRAGSSCCVVVVGLFFCWLILG